jgi:hypothetical protein
MTSRSTSRRTAKGPERQYTSEQLGKFTRAALESCVLAADTLANNVLDRVRCQGSGPHDGATRLHELRAALDQARSEWSRPGEEQALDRAACDALRLHRVCARPACRRAHECRGNSAACLEKADVPEPVLDFVVLEIAKARIPALALLSRTPPEQRAAYDGWIAGIGARG